MPMTDDEIDDKIAEWHQGDSPGTLHEYLGWTREEYAHWVKTGEVPKMKTETTTDPERALKGRVVWTMRDAIRLLKDIDPLLREVGWGVGLTGSVLTQGESRNDLDLIVYPLNDGKVDRDKLRETLESWGWKLKHDHLVVHRAWRRLKSTDCKLVEVWLTYEPNKEGKRVDLFILR